MLGKIYDKIICNESDSIELGRRFDEEVTEIVKPLRQDISTMGHCTYYFGLSTRRNLSANG